MSRDRDRLVIDLYIAGFRVEPRGFAKSFGAPEPNLHTYDIRRQDGALVTRIIVHELGEQGIDTFYLSTAETVTEDVTRIIDMAARQMAAERAVAA
ncbi:hypothetical protein [Sagittula stellata]|uniref:Uncharacterized protein n=1 Tax=Sagittula stellata (strain ATCC 700073 / DSM 11524 / E-37) TaxID=388399 RepID=A3KA40_SAGS3|nr:hypothetical protein [Sagittula stellata]EBA05983.1 hypothetical protein SSE37_25283 [Sagittula stellata E-37]